MLAQLSSWMLRFWLLWAFLAVLVVTERAEEVPGVGKKPSGTSTPREESKSSEKYPTDDAFEQATTKLEDLLAVLDENRRKDKKQREIVEANHNGFETPKTDSSRISQSTGERETAEQLKQKVMLLQEAFTETAAATILGRRPTDEDAMLLSAPLPDRPGTFVKTLFDGHGGDIVAKKCVVLTPIFIGRMPDFSGNSFAAATFAMDAALRRDPDVPTIPGSAGIIAVLEAPDPSVPEFILHVANVGDSRLLVLHEDGTFTRMSVDQSPSDPTESARILHAGGTVVRTSVGVWRIDGRLALSRSFGDFRMKARTDLLPSEQKVVALPHSRTLNVRPGDVLIFACDGVFEAQGMTWSFVANYVAQQLKATGGDLEETAMRLVNTSYLLGSRDNISVMLVKILPTPFPTTKVTAAEVDVLGVRKELEAMLPGEVTIHRSGAWQTDLGLYATLH